MNENDVKYEEFTEKPMDDTLLKFFGVYGFDILTSLTENHWIHAKFCPSFGCPKLKKYMLSTLQILLYGLIVSEN